MIKDKLNIYTKSKIDKNIEAIRLGKEYDINIPLRVLRREEPLKFKLARLSSLKRTEQYRKKSRENIKIKEYSKNYQKASSILRKNHQKEFIDILNKLRN